MAKQANKEERIELRVTPELKARLDAIAAGLRTQRSDIIRLALEQYCDRVDNDPKLQEAISIINQYK